jgi:signal transduction histidine kinase
MLTFFLLTKLLLQSLYEKYFLNLLTNAIKYAKPDHIPTITIQSKIVNGINQLIFSDQGLVLIWIK